MALTVADVLRTINRVPTAEKDMPALVVDNKVYTWNEILYHQKKSALMKKIISEIEKMRKNIDKNRFDFEIDFSKDEILLVEKRLSTMPSDMRIITLGTVFTKEDLIKQLEDRTSLGARIARRELNYVATLWSK